MNTPENKKESWEERFDTQFGYDNGAGDEDYLKTFGRTAGCDGCWSSVQIRREHKEFIAQERKRAVKDALLQVIFNHDNTGYHDAEYIAEFLGIDLTKNEE